MTLYVTYVGAEVLSGDPVWPDGFRIVEAGPFELAPLARRCLVSDDDAPASLHGKTVSVLFRRAVDGAVEVLSRRVVA